jgi:hypothetical protein
MKAPAPICLEEVRNHHCCEIATAYRPRGLHECAPTSIAHFGIRVVGLSDRFVNGLHDIVRVPGVYLTWANPVFLAFFSFNRINNSRVSTSLLVRSPPPLPTIFLMDGHLRKTRGGKKGQIRPMVRFRFSFSGTGDNRTRHH